MIILKELFTDLPLLGLFSALAAFVISTKFYLYPDIINISKIKGLMDVPGERKIHSTKIPNLGGLGVFIAFSLSIIVFGLLTNLMQPDLIKLLALIGSTIILLFLGIKDDLISMSPKKKFIGQLIAVLNVVVLTDVRILSFEGLLGVGELPYIMSILFSVFVFVLVVNALNLIDGIDGLAASIAIIASISFGILFLLNGHYMMTLISSILIGALIGFLKYNFSSKQKIFMGDCGSMLIGFLLAYQGISFLTMNAAATSSNIISNAPIVLLAILSYPLFDLLRVFAIRIKQGRSPFSADANHIHHRLLHLGLDHKRATLLLCVCNAFVIGFTFLLTDFNIHLQLLFTVLTGSFLYLLPYLKVFEANILLNLHVESEEVLPADPQPIVVNDSFEFDLKPMNCFEESDKPKKIKATPLSVDYQSDEEVVIKPADILAINIPNDQQDAQIGKESVAERIMLQQSEKVENISLKRLR